MRRRKEKINLFVIFVVATLLLSFLYANCAPDSSHGSLNETQSEESGATETTETIETTEINSETESKESDSASESESESESEETIKVDGISLNQDTLIFGGGN